MYNVLKNYLHNAEYTLEDAQKRIDYAVARGRITAEQAEDLVAIAATSASAPGPLATLSARVAELEGAVNDMVRVEVVPSDKVGFNWENVYLKDMLIRQEYVAAVDAEGTSENPIPWSPEVILQTNAYYTYDGMRKVWLGENGMTAEWDDERWEEF